MSGTFLDISKAFDKVWHVGLIFELKTYGVEANLLKLLKIIQLIVSKGLF